MAKKSRFLTQAALEALVKFGPQEDALKEAAQTARDTYGTTVQQAHAGTLAIQQAIDAARPRAAQIYDQAGLRQAALNNTLLGHDLAGLGSVADSIKAGAATEALGAATNLNQARTDTLADLGNRRVLAAQGGVAAQRQALDSLTSDLAKVLQAKQDLSGQKGAFKAATIGDLEEAARQRATQIKVATGHNSQSERNSLRSAGIDPDTGKPIPNGKLDPKADPAKKRRVTATGALAVSPDKHLDFTNRVQEIASYVAKYKGKLSRPEIVAKLKTGRSAQTVSVDPKTHAPVADNTPGAIKVHLSSIPQYQPDLAMTAALDIALDGHLSRPTQKALQNHYIVGELNLPTYQQWRRRQKAQPAVKAPAKVPAAFQFTPAAQSPLLG